MLPFQALPTVLCGLAQERPSAHVSFGSTPVIENCGPNFRKEWKAVIRSSRLNVASAPGPVVQALCDRLLFQLQNNWTGHRVSDTKAAAEIFKGVAERI